MPKYLIAEHVQKIYQVEADSADQALVKFYTTELWDHRKEGIRLLREQSSGVYPIAGPMTRSPSMANAGSGGLGLGGDLDGEEPPIPDPGRPSVKGGDATSDR